uniref:Transposase n=1 Tax=Panagrellus redivivus TaxID=6233 RepID=A0A7E4VHE5_PANRE
MYGMPNDGSICPKARDRSKKRQLLLFEASYKMLKTITVHRTDSDQHLVCRIAVNANYNDQRRMAVDRGHSLLAIVVHCNTRSPLP